MSGGSHFLVLAAFLHATRFQKPLLEWNHALFDEVNLLENGRTVFLDEFTRLFRIVIELLECLKCPVDFALNGLNIETFFALCFKGCPQTV